MICVPLLFRLLLRCCSVHVAVLQSLHTPVCVGLVVKMSTSATNAGKSIFKLFIFELLVKDLLVIVILIV